MEVTCITLPLTHIAFVCIQKVLDFLLVIWRIITMNKMKLCPTSFTECEENRCVSASVFVLLLMSAVRSSKIPVTQFHPVIQIFSDPVLFAAIRVRDITASVMFHR